MIDGISIVLCTYNGSARLKPTIEHLADQDLPCLTELVLVDNASTDGSASVVEDIWQQKGNHYPLVLIHASEPGLIHARKAGLQAARHGIVIFCDDDNWLQTDYLKVIQELFISIPEAGLIGGQGLGMTDGVFPTWWFDTNRPGNYAVGKQLPVSGNADQRGYLWGAGLAGKKDLLLHIFNDDYPFLMVGRKGDKVMSGDDSEICLRAMMAGSHLYYDERLVYHHFIPLTRLSESYFRHLLDSFSACTEIVKEYKSALFYSRLSKREILRLFFVRFFNAVRFPKKPGKQRMLRQFISYGLRIRQSVPQEFKVIYDFGKFSKWGEAFNEA